jgi:tetratricopeptide (TPR) repeat protein
MRVSNKGPDQESCRGERGLSPWLLSLTVSAALLPAVAEAAPAPWVEVKSGHFIVITNSGENVGRTTAWQFEQIRAGLAQLWPWAKAEAGPPFYVFAVRNEATLQTLGPQYWEGKRFRPGSFWVNSGDRVYVALRTDVPQPEDVGDNPYQQAYWGYVAATFHRSFPRQLPEWYARGICAVMSNTVVHEKELHVGRLMKQNVQIMRERAPIPLPEFLAADRRSPWVTQEGRIDLFDAQAWALVHYLMFGEEGRNGPKMNRFNRLLHDGVAEDAAIKEAFGDLTPYFQATRTYVTRPVFPFARIPVSLELRSEAFATRRLSPAEAAAMRGDLLVAMGRPVEARAFAAEAAKADPSLPAPWEIEAALLDREGKRDEAKEAYAKAVEAGSKNGHVHYRLAQLEWVPSPDAAQRDQLVARLQAARELDPANGFTLSFLAEALSSQGKHEEAAKLAVEAVKIDPSETYHRLALARILWNARQVEQAVKVAQSALQTADTDEEKKQVQQFLDFAAKAAR